MTEIYVTKTAQNDLNTLDPPVRERIVKKLQKYKQAPRQFAKRLSDSSIGEYRYRIGDDRVILTWTKKTWSFCVLDTGRTFTNRLNKTSGRGSKKGTLTADENT